MFSSRSTVLLTGGALALAAGILADQGTLLGADFPNTALLGLSAGAVVGLIPDRAVGARMTGFVAGFAAAWVGYALRAGFLPDIPMGRAIAASAVIGLVTAVATATSGRVPLWSGLIGAGALVGAYESTFAATPTAFVADSMTAATSVLLACALGLLLTSTLSGLSSSAPPAVEGKDVPLDELLLPTPRRSVDADVEQEIAR